MTTLDGSLFGLFYDLLLALFSAFVVYRVTPLLLTHYDILSPLSTRDSKNVAQRRSPVPVIVRAEPT